jgi:methionyl-tRNA synthetase
LIYLDEYEGKYCVSCEDYISDLKVLDKNNCPFCNSELELIKEQAYFLKLSDYRDFLLQYYKSNPNFIYPEEVKNEMLESFLKKEVKDLCISRKGIKWGVPVPGNKEMVIYV